MIPRRADLFAEPPLIDDLLALEAQVALMLSDFRDERHRWSSG
jgi:hypothetical protein